ncbi:MAG: porin family protein [Gammaproteobacteria bacterium]|nr:porin family protein [Gammaproteobacteria bacterium]
MLNRNLTRNLTRAAAVLALGLSSIAHGLEEPDQAYITPMGTWIDPDGSIAGDDLDSGLQGGQLAVGYALEDNWNIELAAQRLTLEAKDSDGEIDQTGLVLNLLNVYNRSGRFAPYWLAGIGYVNDDAGGNVGDEDNFQAQAGVGLFSRFFGDFASLRSEVVYRWEDAEDSLSDWMVNVGVQIPLGRRSAKPAPRVAEPASAPAP